MLAQKSVIYSFTITLKPNLFKEVAEEQYDRTYLVLTKELLSLSSEVTLVAELTRAANVHYHGMIRFNTTKIDLRKYFIDHFRKSKYFGFVCIKQIDNLQGWQDYIKKDLKTTKQSIGRPPVLIDQFNILEVATLDGYQQELIDEQ